MFTNQDSQFTKLCRGPTS